MTIRLSLFVAIIGCVTGLTLVYIATWIFQALPRSVPEVLSFVVWLAIVLTGFFFILTGLLTFYATYARAKWFRR